MMTDFETRVLARAEQIERRRILAKHGIAPAAGKPKAAVSATAKWNAAVAAKRAAGLEPIKAVQAVNRQFPGLRQKMVAEANDQPAVAKRQPAPVASARERFQAAVEEAVAGGMTKAKAVRHVVLTYPKLHVALLAEANGR